MSIKTENLFAYKCILVEFVSLIVLIGIAFVSAWLWILIPGVILIILAMKYTADTWANASFRILGKTLLVTNWRHKTKEYGLCNVVSVDVTKHKIVFNDTVVKIPFYFADVDTFLLRIKRDFL